MKHYLFMCVACITFAFNNYNTSQHATIPMQGIVSNSIFKTNQLLDENITGFWKLKLEAYDENSNQILDDAERKKGIKNNYSFRFNADGSCRIVESFKGRYEVKTEKGSKMLFVYRSKVEGEETKDPPPDIYHLISLSKTELVLLEDEGDLTFWVFEKINQ